MRTTSLLALILLSTSFVSHQSIAAPASLPLSLGREFFHPRDFEQYGIQIDGHHATKNIRRRGPLQVRAPQRMERKRGEDKPKTPKAKDVVNPPPNNPPTTNNNNPPNNPPNNNNNNDNKPNDNNNNNKPPADKGNKPADNPTATTSKAGNATPTKAPTTSSAASTPGSGVGTTPSTIYSDQPVPTGTLSTGAIAGLSVVGGIFVVGIALFAFVRKKKRDERTSAIVAKSAMAFEQQTHDYEKLEEPSLGTFTVINTYTPTMDDELEIQPGDKVTVLMTYDDGWVQGVNETRDGAKGVFPRHCIDIDGKRTMAYEKRSSSIGGFTSVNLN
jgi:outer membrane biosynthesis protein TonB